MLSIRHFLIFKTVSETGSFTKAAQKLYITQSAVSHTIKELEEDTNTVLFDRLSKHVQLTAGGRLLLREISPVLASWNTLEKRIGQLEKQAPIHIASSITIACFWLPRILKIFETRLPDVPVYVNVVTSSEAIAILQSGGADLALIEGGKPPGPFRCIPFDAYSLRIVCSKSYPLASRKINTDVFCSEKLLLREPESAIRHTVDSQLYLLGYTVRPVWTSVNSLALVEAAKAGLGITILPEGLVKDDLSKGTLIELDVKDLSLKNDLLIVLHKDKSISSALETLLSCIRQ